MNPGPCGRTGWRVLPSSTGGEACLVVVVGGGEGGDDVDAVVFISQMTCFLQTNERDKLDKCHSWISG